MKHLHPRDQEILRLALPSIVQNVTVPLLGLADVAIMGHIGDARYIGAIAVGSMIFNVMYWLCGFLRMGTSGLTAQAYGGSHSTLRILHSSLRLALGIGLAIVVLQMPLRGVSFWLMQPTADVAALCLPYYNICIWGAPAVLGLYALTGWFIGMQDTRTPMMVAIVQNVVNIVLSASFVFLLDMGIAGVALGTLTAQWTGLLIAGWGALRKAPGGLSLRTIWKQQTADDFRPARLLAVNRDIFLRTLCLVAVNLYFTSAGAAQGALMLAVNTLLMQLFTLFSYFMDGFAYAAEAMAGRYYGACDKAALGDVVRRLLRWGWLMAVAFTLLYWAGGTPFLQLLTNDTLVVSAAAHYLPWAVLIPLSGMAAFVWDGVFIGLTRTRSMLMSCAVAAAAFFGLWFALSPSMGNHALWLALLVYLALRGLLLSWHYHRFNRQWHTA